MGWATGDPEKVVQAKVLTAQSRQQVYKLIAKLKEIAHPEKGPVLVALGEKLYNELNEVDLQLNR